MVNINYIYGNKEYIAIDIRLRELGYRRFIAATIILHA